MYKDEKKPSELAKVLSYYDYVFIDTCSLMDEEFPVFMDSLEASKTYWKEDLEVVILKDVENELKKHIKNKDERSTSARIDAKRALKIIKSDRRKHPFNRNKRVFTIWNSVRTDDFADAAISVTVTNLRISNKILIITQDRKLASDLLNLNDSQSQQGRRVEVFRIKSDGTLGTNDGTSYNGNSHDKYAYRNSKDLNRTVKKMNKNNKSDSNSMHTQTTNNNTPKNKNLKKNNKNNNVGEHILEIRKVDSNLKANLNNPNLSKKDKTDIIDKQINRLHNVSQTDKKTLNMSYDVSSLQQLKKTLAEPKTPQKPAKVKDINKKVESNNNKLDHKQKTKASKQNNKQSGISKPLVDDISSENTHDVREKNISTAVKNKSDSVSDTKKDDVQVAYGHDKTPILAVRDYAEKQNIIFRDQDVVYVPAVHGKCNITEQALEQSFSNFKEVENDKPVNIDVNGCVFTIRKDDTGYKAYLNITDKILEHPHKKMDKKADKDPSIKKKDISKNKIAESSRSNKTEKTNNRNDKDKIQKLDNSKNNSVEKDKKVSKTTNKKSNSSKSDKSSNSGTINKKDTAKKVEHKNKGAKVKDAKASIKNNPKSKQKPTVKEINDKALADAKKSEKILKANIKNPNYSKQKKISDLKKQRKMVEALTPRRKTKVEFTVEKIDKILDELQ